MPNQKKTITRDSVFRSTPPPAEAPAAAQGIAQEEATIRQTAIWLSDHELDWLDTHIQKIKRGGWRSVTRSALVRALIRASMQKDIDLTGISGTAELSQRLSQK